MVSPSELTTTPAGLRRNAWLASIGTGGWLASESVAGFVGTRTRAGDKWHLDEVAVKIAGVKHWLWRAVDQDGFVLDVLVQSRRNKAAAERLLRKLLKKQMRPSRVMITDKLTSYGAAKQDILPGVEHRQHKGCCLPFCLSRFGVAASAEID
jgi:IS1 family transposase